jgi:hypothetical protein
MANLLEDLQIGIAIATEISEYFSGQAVSASPTLPQLGKVNISSVILPNGPTPQYTTFSSNLLSDFEEGILASAEWSANQPIMVAVKIGTTWHGLTLAKAS